METADLPGLQTEPMVDFADLVTAVQLLAAGRTATATYEISVRSLPAHLPYLVNAGLEEVQDYLETFELGAEELDLLRQSPLGRCLPEECYEPLYEARFTGTLEAMPEGTVFFAGEPVLRLKGPAHELALVRQTVLSYVLAAVPMATRASRLAQAAGGKPVYEIGGHRPGGRAAALLAARAAFVGGLSGTTSVDAASAHGVPAMAILEHGMLFCGVDADEAAQRLEALGGQVTVLLDPHHPLDAVQELLDLIQPLYGVAMSGDKAPAIASSVRQMLDGEGWSDTRILVVGNRDEQSLDFLADADVPVDGLLVDLHGPAFGQAVPLCLSNDLVEWEADGVRTPIQPPDLRGIVPQGPRMVYRQRGIGCYKQDTVQPDGTEPPSRAVSLLVPMMHEGQRLSRPPSLGEVRALCVSQVQMLPEEVVRVHDFEPYLVEFPYEECQLLEEEEDGAVADTTDTVDDGVPDFLSSLDDSADFTFVSNMEEVVARGLGVDPHATADTSEVVEPLEPMEPAEAVEAMEAMAAKAAEECPVAEPAVEEPAVEAIDESPPPKAEEPKTAKKHKKGKKGKKRSGQTTSEDPVAAAAARLKALKNGGASSSTPAPAVMETSKEADAPAATASFADCAETRSSADPLAAAAARLKALKNGGSTPAASSVSLEKADAALSGVSEVKPVKEKGDKLTSAADRLKALRNAR